MSKGGKISGSGAGLVILCFFMPWVLVSCNGQPVASFSGWKLAAGGNIDTGMGVQNLPGTPILFLILLAGIAVLGSQYMAFKGNLPVKSSAWISIVASAIGMIVLFSQFGNANQQSQAYGWAISFQVGMWGVILGLLAALIGGVIDVPGSDKYIDPLLAKAYSAVSQKQSHNIKSSIPSSPFQSKQQQAPPAVQPPASMNDSIWPDANLSPQPPSAYTSPAQPRASGEPKPASAPTSWKKVSDEDLD